MMKRMLIDDIIDLIKNFTNLGNPTMGDDYFNRGEVLEISRNYAKTFGEWLGKEGYYSLGENKWGNTNDQTNAVFWTTTLMNDFEDQYNK